MENKNNHRGHRERMREDFAKGGFSSWQKHKVLEYLLYYTIPVADTNNMAHELIKRCGGFSNVFRAEKKTLMEVDGIGEKTAEYLVALGDFVRYYNNVKYDKDVLTLNSENCEEYLLNLFDGKIRECCFMICLDTQNKILEKDMIFEGSFESVDIDMPKIARMAVKAEAPYVVFAHNHPSGIAKPSNADIVSTKLIERTLRMLGVNLLDHIIVAGGKCVSMRDGYLDK